MTISSTPSSRPSPSRSLIWSPASTGSRFARRTPGETCAILAATSRLKRLEPRARVDKPRITDHALPAKNQQDQANPQTGLPRPHENVKGPETDQPAAPNRPARHD